MGYFKKTFQLIDCWEQDLDEDVERGHAAVSLALIYLELDRAADAVPHLLSACSLFAKCTHARAKAFLASAHANLGIAREKLDDLPGAVASFQTVWFSLVGLT